MTDEALHPGEIELAWLTNERCELMVKLSKRVALMELTGTKRRDVPKRMSGDEIDVWLNEKYARQMSRVSHQ